jgi:hypothetical protein
MTRIRCSVVVGSVALGTLLTSCATVISTAPPPRSTAPVSVVIRLSHTTVRAGAYVEGTAVVSNHTNETLSIPFCPRGRGVVVGLQSRAVMYRTGLPLRWCHRRVPIQPGRTRLALRLATTQQVCGGSDYPGEPLCVGIGPTPLPTGAYHLRVSLVGLGEGVRVTAPRVTLTVPYWRAALKGSEGSLLVAASPCIGTAYISRAEERVSVVVIAHGHVVARRVWYGGHLFDFSLAPGRYVVRTSSPGRSITQVASGRQTVLDRFERCL